MLFYPNRTVEDQMNRLPLELQEHYKATQLDRIIIDGELITGYFEYSFLEEKSYKEQPLRADDSSMPEIDNITTFLTPRIIIRYNMMNIEDYRKLMRKLQSKNSFDVECYDIVEDARVKHNMYFAPPQMPVIYQQYLMALGVQEFTIELIGTNNSQTYKVLYDFNIPEDVTTQISHHWRVVNASSITKNVIGNLEEDGVPLKYLVPSYTLKGWNTNQDGSGFMYKDGESYFVSSRLILWAQWEKI